MSGKPWAPKDPDEILDYSVDWVDLLDGDTIVSSSWIVPDGLVLDSASHTADVATAWFSGGTLGANYEVTNRIDTAGGRRHDRTRPLQIRRK